MYRKLSVSVRVRASLAGFAVGLKAVAGRVQQQSDRAPADRMALTGKLLGQTPGALARPTERRARIAPGERIYQAFQLRQQFGLLLGQELATTPRPADPETRGARTLLAQGLFQFFDTGVNGGTRQTGRTGHQGDAAASQAHGFDCRPKTQRVFRQATNQLLVFLLGGFAQARVHP